MSFLPSLGPGGKGREKGTAAKRSRVNIYDFDRNLKLRTEISIVKASLFPTGHNSMFTALTIGRTTQD